MDDIVARLTKWPFSPGAVPASDIMDEAADEIERLRRIIAMWEDCAFKTKDLYGTVFVPRTSTYDGGVNRIVSGEWSEPKVSTGRTGNQWFTIPEPPGGAVTEPMLKERRAEVSDANHDAAPAAKARTDADSDRTDKAVLRPGEGTGDSLSEAEIDALECVVEDGQIVGMSVYGVLRSLLVRLRPEWEGEDQEPERTHGVRHTQSECTKQAEGSVPDSKTQNEPVAWLVKGVEYDTGCEYEYVTNFKENAEAAVAHGGCVVPLYSQPSTVVAKSAVAWAVVSDDGVYDSSFGDKAEAYEWRAEVMAEMGREYFVVPLYGSPTLTDAEREAVELFSATAWTGLIWSEVERHAATLRGLLERTK